jgi:beta-glucanase (GH16 family)
LDEKFKKLDPDVWNHEVQVNGFGTGAFDWTTTDPKNSFVDGEGPLNLTETGGDGSCTAMQNPDCSIKSNASTGAIIPPVRSARLNTRGKKGIRYGRIEVEAKLPVGDWLWPAICERYFLRFSSKANFIGMMPEDSKYGEWPASGEIDIMESRGNDVGYEMGGRDTFVSTLHWGT